MADAALIQWRSSRHHHHYQQQQQLLEVTKLAVIIS